MNDMSLKFHMRTADAAVRGLENDLGTAISVALRKHAGNLAPEVLDAILADVEPAASRAAKAHVQQFALVMAKRWDDYIQTTSRHRDLWEKEFKEKAGVGARAVFSNDFVHPYQSMKDALEQWGSLYIHNGPADPTLAKEWDREYAHSLERRFSDYRASLEAQRKAEERQRVIDGYLAEQGLTMADVKRAAREAKTKERAKRA